MYRLITCTPSTNAGFLSKTFAGGDDPSLSPYTNIIQYVTIATTGNAIDFGDLTVARTELTSCSSPTRGIFAGGSTPASSTLNTIDYVAILTTGNAIDFGDKMNVGAATFREEAGTAPTRFLIAGGRYFSGGYVETNVIQYVTNVSTGNAQDFGDLVCKTSNSQEKSTSCTNGHGGL